MFKSSEFLNHNVNANVLFMSFCYLLVLLGNVSFFFSSLVAVRHSMGHSVIPPILPEVVGYCAGIPLASGISLSP